MKRLFALPRDAQIRLSLRASWHAKCAADTSCIAAKPHRMSRAIKCNRDSWALVVLYEQLLLHVPYQCCALAAFATCCNSQESQSCPPELWMSSHDRLSSAAAQVLLTRHRAARTHVNMQQQARSLNFSPLWRGGYVRAPAQCLCKSTATLRPPMSVSSTSV